MTITELRYVVALAKEQHFGRAADYVHVSQPTLSAGIKKIENELGVKIFERLPSKVIATKVGSKIIAVARETLASTERIRSIAKQAKGDIVGELKLGIIFSICPYLLPKLVPHLRGKAKKLDLFIEEGFTAELIQKLKDGELDIAITSLPIEDSVLLNTYEIGKENFYVILPEDHPLSHKKDLDFSDINSEKLFILGNGNCFREQVIAAYHKELTAQKIVESELIIGGSLETIRVMVRAGLGLSIFPAMALNNQSGLAVVPFKNPQPYRKIAIVSRKSFIQENIVHLIADCTKQRLI